ncbi:MAG: HDOD domain-containing protein [Gemmataceae bacterium]|nr:HDOD domain-containing protein [Gemmataceae bacterium]
MTQATELVREPLPHSGDTHVSRGDILAKVLANPNVPSPPALALQIVQKASDPNCNLREISDLLACDPGLCGRLLKLVNSAIYAPPRPVTTISQAIPLLGVKRLRSLVLGMSIPAMQVPAGSERGLQTFWRTSVAGAIIARELARKQMSPSPEDDLVTALLRDLGIVLLHQTFPNKYEPVWSGKRVLRAGERYLWEERNIGINHAEVSAELAKSWRLPDSVVEPIRFHHAPLPLPKMPPLLAKRARLLNFAGRLAELEEAEHTAEDFHALWCVARKEFDLAPDELEDMLSKLVPTIEEFASILQLNIGASPQFAAALNAGVEALARLSMELAETGDGMDTSIRTTPAAPRLKDGGIPDRLQQYEIRRELGRGSMGAVFEGFDPGLGRPVAIKVVLEHRNIPLARERFLREAQTAAAVRHENVVTVYATGEDQGIPFLVMEFVRGKSLQDWLDQGRRFTFPEIIRIGREIALGLAAAHDLRIVHRDIKPANILLEDKTERVRLTDFGVARALDSRALTADGNIVGTPMFMSPEQVAGEELDTSSDLFSLGSVLYLLCTGKPPFEHETVYGTLLKVATADVVPIRKINPQVPETLARVIEQLHARNPIRRPSSARDAADMLAQCSAKL